MPAGMIEVEERGDMLEGPVAVVRVVDGRVVLTSNISPEDLVELLLDAAEAIEDGLFGPVDGVVH